MLGVGGGDGRGGEGRGGEGAYLWKADEWRILALAMHSSLMWSAS